MIETSTWLELFKSKLKEIFSDRVFFIGLQGSYSRNEATESSDIDMVVILDDLMPIDIVTYNNMLDTLPHRDKICGFLSGKNELLSWESSDLFSLFYDTLPLYGDLCDILIKIDDEAVKRAIKIGVCNIYHGCVHNMLYEKSLDILKGLYKSASYVVRAIYFRNTGKYIKQLHDLKKLSEKDEQNIIENIFALKNDDVTDFTELSNTLFLWTQKWIQNLK